MPKRIHKYIVPQDPNAHNVMLTKDAKLLDFQFQGSDLVVWVEEDTSEKLKSSLMYAVLFTGEEVLPYYKYYKTLQKRVQWFGLPHLCP
jgi:hypothetical protein